MSRNTTSPVSRTAPREGKQGLRLWLLGNGQNLDMSIHAKGGKTGQVLKIVLEEDVWTWITIVGTDKKSIIAYQDGKEIARGPGVDFDNRLPLNDISIGANSFDERRRTFNGSFSIVRVYDKALSPTQVLSNAKGVFSSRRSEGQTLDDVGKTEDRFIVRTLLTKKVGDAHPSLDLKSGDRDECPDDNLQCVRSIGVITQVVTYC